MTCTRALGYRKRIKTDFDWTVRVFTSYEVCMKYIHCELSNLIEQFECTMVQVLT